MSFVWEASKSISLAPDVSCITMKQTLKEEYISRSYPVLKIQVLSTNTQWKWRSQVQWLILVFLPDVRLLITMLALWRLLFYTLVHTLAVHFQTWFYDLVNQAFHYKKTGLLCCTFCCNLHQLACRLPWKTKIKTEDRQVLGCLLALD